MYLTKEEEKIYDGEKGPLYEWAMRFLTAYGDGLKAERLIKVSAAYLAGFETLKWAVGPNLYKEFFKTRMAVPTYCQGPECTHQDMGVLINDAGCAPYHAGWIPRFGTHVASIESALYVAINSIFGARTHRESYPGICAIALIGKTPYAGLHTDEGRRGNLLVKVKTKLRNPIEYEALGYHVSAFVTDWDIPVFIGTPNDVGIEELKSIGSALQMKGSVGLFHVVGITPEAPTIEYAFGGNKPQETITVGDQEIKEACANLSRGETKDINYVILGCPHYSIKQLGRVADLLRGKKVHEEVKLRIYTAPGVRLIAEKMGIKNTIEDAGGEVCIGCWEGGYPLRGVTVATNSSKCATYNLLYGSRLMGESSQLNNIHFGTLERCINAAINKKWGN
jgi:predicted aconitase